MSVGYQSFYQAQLTAGISDTDTTIPLDVVPTVDEGFLVIESTVPSKREIIYYTSKTSNSVICPSGAGNGRGYDGTTAVSHLQGAAVIMAPVGAMFSELRQQFTTTPQGWTNMVQNITGVTANGNRSYTATFNADVSATLSEGMRLRTTRTTATTATCFSLDGSNDYFNKTSPAGMTFTDDFSVSAWVYLTAYTATRGSILTRFNGTSGFRFSINAAGQVELYGNNAGGGNYSGIISYQSVPLNRWAHIAAQLDMSTFTATTTTSYIMIDGKDVPASVSRGGTNPTALVQAGNLEISSENGGAYPLAGYLKDICIYNSKVTQATILDRMHQTPTGSETNLISAYTGANTTDLNTTNANNLTAQNGAVSGFASAPYGNRGVSTTLDYGLVMAVSGSTVTVQVPEGCTIPTTGGVSAVAYSVMASPYGFVTDKGRWEVSSTIKTSAGQSSPVNGTWYNPSSIQISVPTGKWLVATQYILHNNRIGADALSVKGTLSTANNTESDPEISGFLYGASVLIDLIAPVNKSKFMALSSATTHYLNIKTDNTTSWIYVRGDISPTRLTALPTGL